MLRPRLAIAAIATAVTVAGGISAAVLTEHRPTGTATATTVATTQPPPTTSPPSPTSTSESGGTGTGGTTPTTPAGPPRIPEPALAARHLFSAWQAGDRQRALEAATPAAVRALFALAPSPRPRFTGCHDHRSLHDCNYRYPDGNADGMWYITMEVDGGASAGYHVVAIDVVRRFANPDLAARYLMSAWLAGDRADAGNAASASAVNALWSRLGDRSYQPRFAGCTYRDLGSDCAYDYTTVGLGLSMRVEGGASLGWTVNAVKFANA